MAATLKQIAAKTGLSIPTVHQILNGYNVSFAEATRKKVLAAAAELNYRPNISARSLVAQRSFLVGVLLSGPNVGLVTAFMRGVQNVVKAAGCSPIFFTHNSAAEEEENLQSVLDRRVDGIIINAAVDPEGSTNAARIKDVSRITPVVEVFGRFVPEVPKVTFDHAAAARAATSHLIADGHTRIAVAVRPQHHDSHPDCNNGRFWNLIEFVEGYKSIMKSSRLKARVHSYGIRADEMGFEVHYRSAFQILPTLFNDPDTAPTAVMCANVAAAEAILRFYDGLDRRFSTPLTVAVLGEVRPLTSSRLRVMSLLFPTERAGTLASEALLAQIAGHPSPDETISPQLVLPSVFADQLPR